ncbi:MAG TPA: neutral zinc metallopeptidase [Actinopolymorphaceae bacterium]
MPPRKKKGSGGGIVAAVLGGVAVVVAGIAVFSSFGDAKDSPTAYSSPTYEPATTDPYPSADASPTASSSSEASPSPSATTSSPSPSSTRRTPERPPDIEVLRKNKLYQVGTQKSVGCREPSVRPSSKENARRYYAGLIACLNKAWPSQMRQAGAEFRAPTVMIWSGSFESPCGSGALSFYCGRNETIYMRWDFDVNQYNKFSENYQKVYARMSAMHTVAHEYGHHVQQLTGILPSAWNLRYNASQSTSLELSRRTELQASCLANVFLGTNQPSLPITGEARRQWDWLVEHLGDEYSPNGVRDHGKRANHGYWAKRGFRSESPESCNTFTAPSSRVS